MPPDIQTVINLSDALLSIIYIGLIILAAWWVRSKNKHLPQYKYFLPGLCIKLFGAIIFCIIYTYFYKEGDTLVYFYSSKAIASLAFKDPVTFVKIIFLGDVSFENLSKFNSNWGWPIFLNDEYTFFFIRLITPLNLLAFGNFMTTTILLSAISYTGIWKIYTVFIKEYPELLKRFAISMFFIPSVVFWSSGLLKDTVTFMAVGWFVYSLYRILNNQKHFIHLIQLVLSTLIILFVKPYILYALVSSAFIWIAVIYLRKISESIDRYVFAPIILLLFTITSLFVVYQIGEQQGRFSLQGSQTDFIGKQSQSKGNSSFYKEPVNNSFTSITKSILVNVCTSLFRPYLWEAKNSMMIGAALENIIFLSFLIWILLQFRSIYFFRRSFRKPFLIFCLCFILTLSLIIGISTDNFGTLDRFRIPVLPFYLSLCFITTRIVFKSKIKPI